MKRHVLLLAPFAVLSARAQITIGPNDMPEAGDTLRHRVSTLASFDGALTGTAYTWDFSDLDIGTENADTVVSVGSTPLLYQFYFNNPFLYPAWDADHALRGPSIDFQVVSIADVYDYYKTDADAFRNVGFGATINGLPASVRRDPIDQVYELPLQYGNTDSGDSEFIISIPTLGTYGQSQTRTNEVDGWGTLYLPADTFEVLRVKSTLQRTDTLYVDQFGFGFSFPEPEIIEYKWLAVGEGQPVLQVNTLAGAPTLVRFVYEPEDFSTGVATSMTNAPVLFPNPANSAVRVQAGSAGMMEVRDAHGRSVHQQRINGPGIIDVATDQLADGVYSVRLDGSSAPARLLVAH